DRLPPEEKHLLQTAAVIGTDVSLPLLQTIADLPEAVLHRGLAHVQAAEFLYRSEERRVGKEWRCWGWADHSKRRERQQSAARCVCGVFFFLKQKRAYEIGQ